MVESGKVSKTRISLCNKHSTRTNKDLAKKEGPFFRTANRYVYNYLRVMYSTYKFRLLSLLVQGSLSMGVARALYVGIT